MNDVIYIKRINNRWRVWRGDASDWTNNSYNCGVRVLPDLGEAR